MSKIKPFYTIAVTGLNAIDSPGPGISVIRGLREAQSFNVRIIGLAYESLEPGIYMHDLIDKTYQVPYPSAGTEALYNRLMYIHSKEKLDCLIPNFDAELFSYIKLESQLQEAGIALFIPTMQQLDERHKHNLPDFGKKYDLLVPPSKAIFSEHELFQLTNPYSFPYVVKGKFYDAIVVQNIEQAQSAFHKIAAKWGTPIIIQQFIKGNEFNVIGVGDGKGNTIAAVPMRKQYITDKGKAWAGVSIEDPELIQLTNKFISATKWRSGFELELMKNEKGEFFIMEINPRIPAWVYLAVGAGQNIPEAIANLAITGTFEPFTTFKKGKLFIRYSWDMIVDIEEFEKISTTGEL